MDAMISLALAAIACIVRPHHARCPDAMWLSEGVSRSGAYACTYKPVGGDHWNGRAWVDDSVVSPGRYESLIYCTNGSDPINVDGITVSCQARH
jgi:hypothetical protein